MNMKRFMPFLSASMAVHLCGFAAIGMFVPAMTGIAGDPFGDPDRVFISVVSDQDLTPVASTPAPVDSPEAVDSEKAKEEAVPEATPEVLAKETPDSPTEFNQTTIEEIPDAESQVKEQEKKKEKQQDESSASNPQVASTLLMRRAALGTELRDFQSLLLAAIRRATFFPQEALKDKRHGQVMVAFTISKDGQLSRVEVKTSSGSQTLDDAAVEIMRKASEKFPLFPASLSRETLDYTVPIRFKEKRGEEPSRMPLEQ
ncbi:MAG: energy transducer TonB [Desulfomonile tiedjei]|uniref:Energy transducer TonB n=1 Tax=Desulfomonile tiedjei TaxID=2358 RepID=A0A9D6Z7L6_9BACT|nr:energy transducer TonB [Desulfomonile tiedjei]